MPHLSDIILTDNPVKYHHNTELTQEEYDILLGLVTDGLEWRDYSLQKSKALVPTESFPCVLLPASPIVVVTKYKVIGYVYKDALEISAERTEKVKAAFSKVHPNIPTHQFKVYEFISSIPPHLLSTALLSLTIVIGLTNVNLVFKSKSGDQLFF